MSSQKEVSSDSPPVRYFVSMLQYSQAAGIRPPMGSDRPFGLTIPQTRHRTFKAKRVLARRNGDTFLIFSELDNRYEVSKEQAIDAIRSEGKRGTLTAACGLPADVSRLGHIVAEVLGYSIVCLDPDCVRRDRQEGSRS
jgi:hypothetical protein